MSKAMFVQVLIEGANPSTPPTTPELDAWIGALKLPFSVLRDPDGAAFAAKKTLGIKETTYIVERATGKILAKSLGEAEAIAKLESLP